MTGLMPITEYLNRLLCQPPLFDPVNPFLAGRQRSTLEMLMKNPAHDAQIDDVWLRCRNPFLFGSDLSAVDLWAASKSSPH